MQQPGQQMSRASGGELHTVTEVPLANQALEVRLDLARQRHRLLAIQRDV